jgi:hypothetical protein
VHRQRHNEQREKSTPDTLDPFDSARSTAAPGVHSAEPWLRYPGTRDCARPEDCEWPEDCGRPETGISGMGPDARGAASYTRCFLASHAIPSQHHPTCEAVEDVALARQAGAASLPSHSDRTPIRHGRAQGGQDPPYLPLCL